MIRQNHNPPVHITLSLNARFQTMHRHELEDTLEELLSKTNLGYTDGGCTMQFPSGEIESCDIEIILKDGREENIAELESMIDALGVAKGSKLLLWNEANDVLQSERPAGRLEGMALYLNGTELPEEVYAFQIFDNQSIEESLNSGNPLVRILALLDGRVGKRRLLALGSKMEQELPWVRVFYIL